MFRIVNTERNIVYGNNEDACRDILRDIGINSHGIVTVSDLALVFVYTVDGRIFLAPRSYTAIPEEVEI